MITLKKTHLFFIIIISFFIQESYSQTKESTIEKWNKFKEAAHKIGFCIYHVEMKECSKHSNTKHELEKISEPEDDIYYFQLKPLWAAKKIKDWAKSRNSNDFFIIFDIDQKSFKKLYDASKTSNSYNRFSILDLKNKYDFKLRQASNSNLTFYISSNKKEAMLTNTMWREFFSHRAGRRESEIKITIEGKNALVEYKNFNKAFNELF